MTEIFMPEPNMQLVRDVRERREGRTQTSDGPLLDELADALESAQAALTAVSAERDRLHKAITEALAFESVLPAIATEPRRILRAALDKEGNDDE